MTKGLTRKDKDLLYEVRTYGVYAPERCVQIWYELLTGERKTFPRNFLEKKSHRMALIHAFVDEHRNKHTTDYPLAKDFFDNKLSTLLNVHYGGSCYLAFQDAGYMDPKSDFYDKMLHETPWLVLKVVPRFYWRKENNKKKAIYWLMEKTGKKPTDITRDNFLEWGLAGLLSRHGASPYNVIKHVDFDIKPLEMRNIPSGYWERKTNRRNAIRDMIRTSGKRPKNITSEDFKGTFRKLLYYYDDSVYLALKDVGYNVDSLELRYVPRGTWKNMDNVRNAMKRVSDELDKPINELTAKEIKKLGYRGILTYYKVRELRKMFGTNIQ